MKTRIVPAKELVGSLRAEDHMPPKRYVSSNWLSDENCEYCRCAVAELTPRFLKSLAKLKKMFMSQFKKDHTLVSMTFWDGTPDYYNANITDADTDEQTHVIDEGSMPVSGNIEPERTELDQLVITERGFYWTCQPKHLTVHVETDLIEWKEVGL
jgi:hypothetical protein